MVEMVEVIATEWMGMYCDVCEENGEPNDGFHIFEMELIDIEEECNERSIHTYRGKCPKCGTVHRYISHREEVYYTFDHGE